MDAKRFQMSMNALTRAAYVQMDTVRTTWVDMNVSVRLDTLIIKPKPDVLVSRVMQCIDYC